MPDELPDILVPEQVVLEPLDSLLHHPLNARQSNVGEIIESIRRNGVFRALRCQRSSRHILAGNGEYDALRTLGYEQAPVEWLDVDDELALDILVADNGTSDDATYDEPRMAELLSELAARREGGLVGLGWSRERFEALLEVVGAPDVVLSPPSISLAERFGVPPFTILDARAGYWQARKAAWLGLGIKSEIGRPRNLLKFSEHVLESQRSGGAYMGTKNNRLVPNRSMPSSDSGNDPQFFYKKRRVEAILGHEISVDEFLSDHYDGPDAYIEGTSVFDPVLCELAYRWWSPPGALIYDPFAGGSVRGIVASMLGREYLGLDLSAMQIAANEEQAASICGDHPMPRWVEGDACAPGAALGAPERLADLLFTCPPYFDLEQYSDDPRDLSNAGSWARFGERYGAALEHAVRRLARDRFAVLVVGNVREHTGNRALYDLAGLTVELMAAAGCEFYNDAVLVTATGSLALRAARIFRLRKLGRTHQQVLVFVKGNAEAAVAACGEVEPWEPEQSSFHAGGDGSA